MKTDTKAKGKPDSDKSIADNKIHRPVAKAKGKQAGKKRKKPSEIPFANIIEKINEGFVALDAQMNYTYINQRGSELLRRKPEELIGKNYWEEYPQDKDTSFGKAYLRALETQTPIELEDYYEPSERWFENRIYPTENGLSIFFNDITEKKYVEAELKNISRLPVENPSPVMRLTPDGNILYANQASASLLDFWKQQVGQTIPDELRKYLRETFASGAKQQIEIEHYGKTFSCTLAPILEAGYINLYGNEITEHKRAERALIVFARQQEALYQLTDQLHHTKSVEDVFNAALDAILSALSCDRASILLFDEMNVMRFIAWRGLSDEYRQVTDGHSPWKSDEKNPEPIYFNDIEKAELNEPLKIVVKREGIGALAFIPLVFNGQLMGKFMTYFDTPHEFSESEIDLSLTIGRQLAVSIKRKQDEHTLRESEARLRLATEAAQMYSWELDIQQQRYTVSENFTQVLGFSPESLSKNSFETLQKLSPPEDAQLVSEAIAHAIENYSDLHALQYRIFHPESDEVIWLEVNAKVMFGSTGKAERLVGVTQNITKSKIAEEKLRVSEDRLRLAVAAGKIGIWDIDLLHRDRTWSDEGKAIYGLAAHEFLDYERQLALIHPDDRAYVDKLVTAFRDQGNIKQINLQHRILRPDGSLCWVEVHGEAIYEDGPLPVRLIGTVIDITERKRNEAALQHAREQAEEIANRISRLQQITSALTKPVTPAQLAEIVLEQGTQAAQAAAGILVELMDNGQEVKTMAAIGYPAAAVHTEPVPLSAPTPISDCIRTRQAVWIRSHDDYASRYPSIAQFRRSLGNEATAALPLIVGDKVLGGLAFSFAETHEFADEEQEFFLAVAQQCAQGLERVYIEEALRESEQRFRILANTVPSMIWTAAPNGTITYANDQWVHFVGLTPEENATKWPELVLHPDDHERWLREWTHALETVPDEYLIEVRNRRYDGQYRWFQTRAVPLRDGAGEVTGWYGVTTDIHGRIEGEKRLVLLAEISELIRKVEDPNELLYMVAKATGEHFQARRCLFNETDLENDVEIVHRDYYNGVASVAGVHKISDYSSVTSAEMAAGKTVVNFDSKVDARTAQDYERSYVANGERAYIAVPLMRDNRWVATLWVSDDVPRVWSKEEISLVETIAERTWTAVEWARAQEVLQERNEQVQQVLAELQTTYEQSPVGMLQLDTDLRYVRVNETLAAMNGFPAADHIGKTIHEMVPALAAQIEAAFRTVIETGQPVVNVEVEGETAAEPGVLHTWIESWFPLRNGDGQVIGLNVVAQDITKRKRAEEALQRLNESLEERVVERTAALAESEREVRRIASMLTRAEQEERRRISQLLHDELQQQLYAIQINLAFTRRDVETGETKTALAKMAEIEQWLRQGIEITRQLTVDLSPPILKSEGLTDALNWLISQMKRTHGLEVSLTAEHAFRMGDEDMRVLLFQIIRELLFNVIKHAGTDEAAVKLGCQNDQLMIEVTDEGHGFSVAEAVSRAEREGRFGLFSVRERLGLFGGHMEIDSVPGRGTRIIIYIPIDFEAESL